MESLFQKLDKGKQEKIFNASLHVFSANDFKHALTDDIASKAQISKGSLFQYFKNKRDLYIYSYAHSLEELDKKVNDQFNFQERDFFALLHQSLLLKIALYKEYPYLYQFVVKANEEKDPEISQAINEINQSTESNYFSLIYKDVDYSKFKEGSDIQNLFKMVGWCSEGIWNEGLKNQISVDAMHQQASSMLEFFKQVVYKQEYLK